MTSVPTTGAPLRLLAVHAHPDDESSKGAASAARYAREGVAVLVATCTGGERGSVLNPALDSADVRARLPEIRRAEMARAASILGVQQTWLGFVDSGFPQAPDGEPVADLEPGCFAALPLEIAAGPLVALVRRFRPHVMTTYDERGGYPHPDHVRSHEVALEAFDAAGDPDRYPGLGGAPWQALKLYYHVSFHRERLLALHEAALAHGLASPYTERLALATADERPSVQVTTRVPCGEFFGVRDEALRAHATQVDPNGRWFALPLDVQREAWPTEDFHLARSLVDTALPEDDLFAGVRDTVAETSGGCR